jgi:hypothetical protein
VKPNQTFAAAFRGILLALLLSPAVAKSEPLTSLMPVFGVEGAEFTHPTQKGQAVSGWLPTGWVDNSEWAAIAATYEKLDDFPDDAFGAVRIKLKELEADAELQVTSYEGERTLAKGKPYRVFGWVRSPESHQVAVTLRQLNEPYQQYARIDIPTSKRWAPFELNFQPDRDLKAIVVVGMQEVGTLDLASVTLVQGGVGPSLLPAFGTEGAEFSTQATQGNLIHGWLPTDWVDNSEWGPVSATYSRLDDGPRETLGAVRIQLEKIGEGGQLQLTAYGDEVKYLPGKSYRIAGWVRSADRRALTVGLRQSE